MYARRVGVPGGNKFHLALGTIRRHKEIKNGEQYVALEIYLKLDCLDKREVTTSGSRDYVRRAGKCLTTALNIRTKIRPNKKQKARTYNTDVVPKYFMKLIE